MGDGCQMTRTDNVSEFSAQHGAHAGRERGDGPRAAPESEGGALPLAAAIGSKRLIAAILIMPVVFVLITIAIVLLARGRDRSETAGERAVEPIILPAGASIVEMTQDGAVIALRVEGRGGAQLIIYDGARGALIARVPMIAAPEAGLADAPSGD